MRRLVKRLTCLLYGHVPLGDETGEWCTRCQRTLRVLKAGHWVKAP